MRRAEVGVAALFCVASAGIVVSGILAKLGASEDFHHAGRMGVLVYLSSPSATGPRLLAISSGLAWAVAGVWTLAIARKKRQENPPRHVKDE